MADDGNSGASGKERLLFACRTDNLSLFQDLVSDASTQLNVNTTDSFGMTPLHLCVLYQSTEVIQSLLEEEVDVDLRERTKGDTPLHVACRIEGDDNEEMRNWLVDQLLSSGADPRIRNNAKEKPEDLLIGVRGESEAGKECKRLLREAEGQLALGAAAGIVVNDEREDRPGADSASDSE